MTGEVKWSSVGPGEKILHGQWSSPAIGAIGGVKQVIFPGGDGRLYAYEPETGKELWSFQCNPDGTVHKLGGRGTRNELIATPVIYKERVYIAMGQDPEYGEGAGHMYAVDGTKRGDISKTGVIWRNDEVNRGLATVSIFDNVLYHCDLSGNFRAIDPETGKVLWRHEMGSAVWSSPYYVDGKVFMGDEDGHMVVFAAGKEKKILNTMEMDGSVYTTPVAANGVLYVTTREKLYAIQQGAVRREEGELTSFPRSAYPRSHAPRENALVGRFAAVPVSPRSGCKVLPVNGLRPTPAALGGR